MTEELDMYSYLNEENPMAPPERPTYSLRAAKRYIDRDDPMFCLRKKKKENTRPPIYLKDLEDFSGRDHADVVNEIAQKLRTTNTDIISSTILLLGQDTILEVYNKTRLIERNGGQLVKDKSRRRTPAGTFCKLLKTVPMSTVDFNIIFKESRRDEVEEDNTTFDKQDTTEEK
ncbi:phosphorylated adapter RNA export protein-like [Teleopsis dalmanni]|uniref:phosphorylated adapter RNA export protein-like n=1 Tax=Teleopsis dalmanni TaxID=139649 RepID=UPI0018CC95E0|nr:phosphorylated adapter RNA export protein-like [Teleopsis dalmanni]